MAFVAIFTFIAIICAAESRSCSDRSLARYRVTFTGEWSEQRFPNQYPLFRPNAQWSKMIGRTHNNDYKLWSKGAVASFGLKEFVQDAESDRLDQAEVQGFNGVYDAFFGPPVKQGVGQSQADFIAVSTHSKVSVTKYLGTKTFLFIWILVLTELGLNT